MPDRKWNEESSRAQGGLVLRSGLAALHNGFPLSTRLMSSAEQFRWLWRTGAWSIALGFPKGKFLVTVTPAGFLPNPRLCTAMRVLGGGGGLSFHCLRTESAPWPAVQVTTPGFPNKEIPLGGCWYLFLPADFHPREPGGEVRSSAADTCWNLSVGGEVLGRAAFVKRSAQSSPAWVMGVQLHRICVVKSDLHRDSSPVLGILLTLFSLQTGFLLNGISSLSLTHTHRIWFYIPRFSY